MNFWERYNDCVGNNGGRDGNRTNQGGQRNGNGQNGQRNSQDGYAGSNNERGGYSEQDIRRKFDEYSGKNESELMSELAQTVARMKSEGTFDAAAIENMYNTAAPFLNDMQRQRMRSIIDMLVK